MIIKLKPKDMNDNDFKQLAIDNRCSSNKDLRPSKVRHISVEDYLSNELQGHKDF